MSPLDRTPYCVRIQRMNQILGALGLSEFLEKAAKAMGGWDLILSVQTYFHEAKVTIQSPAGVLSGTLRLYRARGGRIRIEERLGSIVPSIRIVNGQEGWLSESAGDQGQAGFRPLEQQELEEIRRGVLCWPRNLIAHAREHRLSDPVLQPWGGSIVWKLTADDLDAEYVFDAETLLCHECYDAKAKRTTRFDDYRPSDGVLTAWHIESFEPSQIRRIEKIQSARHNLPLGETLFVLPET